MKAYEVYQTDVQEGITVHEKTLASGAVIKFNLIALQTDCVIGGTLTHVTTASTRGGKTKLREISPSDDGKAVVILRGYCHYRGSNRVTWNDKVSEIASSSGKNSPGGRLGSWTNHVLICEPGAEIKHVAEGRRATRSDIQYISWDGTNLSLVTQEELDLT